MKTIIIAEAGVNHNGSLKKQMVDIANKADFIKFQTFVPEYLSGSKLGLAQYQKNLKYSSQLEMLKKLSLSFQNLKD